MDSISIFLINRPALVSIPELRGLRYFAKHTDRLSVRVCGRIPARECRQRCPESSRQPMETGKVERVGVTQETSRSSQAAHCTNRGQVRELCQIDAEARRHQWMQHSSSQPRVQPRYDSCMENETQLDQSHMFNVSAVYLGN